MRTVDWIYCGAVVAMVVIGTACLLVSWVVVAFAVDVDRYRHKAVLAVWRVGYAIRQMQLRIADAVLGKSVIIDDIGGVDMHSQEMRATIVGAPELRYTAHGLELTTFSVETAGVDGDQECVAFGDKAVDIMDHAAFGMAVKLYGYEKTRTWRTRDGKEHSATNFVVTDWCVVQGGA